LLTKFDIKNIAIPVEESCNCYTQTIEINQDNDTIYKSTKIYGQNFGTCGHIVDLVLPDNNPFVTSHHITNCDLD